LTKRVYWSLRTGKIEVVPIWMDCLPNKNVGEIWRKEVPYIVRAPKLPLMGLHMLFASGKVRYQCKAGKNAFRAKTIGYGSQNEGNFRLGKISDCCIPNYVVELSVGKTVAQIMEAVFDTGSRIEAPGMF
jgi:hypothetical protein